MKIGIIYCPIHKPFTTSQKRWKEIAALLEAHELEYDMVQSEERQSVERLVNMFINNGYKTIVIAGGDAALNDAVNCFMRVEKRKRDEMCLGVIPNGSVNDFASFWGLTYENIEKSIKSLKQRRIKKIDVGCVRYTDKEGEKKNQYFLNCVNVGLLASIQKLRQNTRRIFWSRKVSFATSLVLMMFQRLTYKIRYTINHTEETHKITTLCVGNACGYGLTPNATPYNGTLDVTVLRSTMFLQYVEAVWFFIRGKLLNHKRIIPYRTHEIDIQSERNIPVNIDGRPIKNNIRSLSVNIDPEEINFIMEEWKS